MRDKRTELFRMGWLGTGFLGRGLLLILPVLVLSALGLLSLRQDRKILESEVQERSQAFVDEAINRCWKRLATLSESETNSSQMAQNEGFMPACGFFRVSANGNLTLPPPVQAVPTPAPVNLSEFNIEQTELWRRIEMGGTDSNLTNRINTLRAFLETHPPSETEARVRFRMAMLMLSSDKQKAAGELRTIINRFPESSGETGIPLSVLAMMQLADLSLSDNEMKPVEIHSTLDLLASNAVAKPTLLSPWILSRITGWEAGLLNSSNISLRWNRTWAIDEQHRRAFASALKSLSMQASGGKGMPDQMSQILWPDIFYFSVLQAGKSTTEQTNGIWLAVRSLSHEDGSKTYLYRNNDKWSAILQEFRETETSLPDYLGVYYQITSNGGTTRTVPLVKQKGGYVNSQIATPRQIIASASHRSDDGKNFFSVSVSLLDPSKLYARQRQRVYLFGGLIVLSALAGLFGFASTWSAFQRQKHLYQIQTNFVSSVTHELRAPIGSSASYG